MFTLDIDLYFWMIDRGDLEDDQRNKVEIEQQRVKLHRDYSQRLENGVYVARLMQVIRKTIIKKSKKPFTLDAQLNSLKDQMTANAKQYNWNLVVSELRKFNIKIAKEHKAQIIGGKHSLIHDIVQKLHDYDHNILSQPTVAGPIGQYNQSQQAARARMQEVHSELNFGTQGNGILDQAYSPSAAQGRADAHNLTHQYGESDDGGYTRLPGTEKPTLFKESRNSEAILRAAPTQKSRLDPIEHLTPDQQNGPNYNPAVGPHHNLVSPMSLDALGKQSQQSPNREGLDLDSVAVGLPNNYARGPPESHLYLNQQFDNLLGANQSQDGRDPDENTLSSTAYPDANYQGRMVGLAECVNTLNFILESLSQSLGLTQSQAAALLANSQKYLIHLCIKGMKGKDYSKLVNWYKLVMHNSWKLVELLYTEQDDVKSLSMTLNVLKCGLFSESAEVACLCCRTITKISSIIYDRAQADPSGSSLRPQFWDWLNHAQKKPILNANNSPPPKNNRKQQLAKKQQDLEKYLDEAGLRSFIKSHRKHQSDFVELFAAALVQFGRDNYVDLFTNCIKQQSDDMAEYLMTIQDVYEVLSKTSRGNQAFVDSGAFQLIVDMCLRLNETAQNPFTQLNQIQLSLTLLAGFWRSKPEVVQSRQNNGKTTDAIIQALKRGCRETRSKTICITSINLMFFLLDAFAKDRNQFAPILYKALTFILIDGFGNPDQREEILKNFIILFQKYQNIPISILCEPLFKQIEIILDKQEYHENTSNRHKTILQPQAGNFTLNTTDFELFHIIAVHPKLNVQIARQLLEIVSLISRKNIIFTRVSLKLLLTVLGRFQNNTQIYQYCQNLVLQLLTIIIEQDTVKMEIYGLLLEKPKYKAYLRKKAQLGPSEFYVSPGGASSHNVKYNHPIDKRLEEGELIDDSQIQKIIHPNNNQEESAQYMAIKTQEKLIINLLQCLIQSGVKVLGDFIQGQVLDQYIKIEQKHKFKNKGLLYLLGLYETDVAKMIQFSKQKAARGQASKVKRKHQEQRQQAEQWRKRQTEKGPSLDYLPGEESFDGDRNPMSDSLDATLNDQKKQLPNYMRPLGKSPTGKRSPSPKQRIQGRNMLVERASSIPLRQYGENDAGEGELPHYMSPKALKRKRNDVKAIKSLERPRGGLAGRDLSPERGAKLYDINQDTEAEQKRYLLWVKEHLRLYKAMFHKYSAGTNEKSRALYKGTFEAINDSKNSMSLTAVFQFLADFKITKLEFAKREEIKRIIKLINLKQETQINAYSNLDIEGFIEFNLQLAYYMYRETSERPSKFMPMLFERLKACSLATKTPLFQKLFEDPSAPAVGDPDIIRKLTQLVNQNPNYELPPGYTKVLADKIQEIHEPDPRVYRTEAQRAAIMILDDICSDTFDMHVIEPIIKYEKQWVVRADVFKRKQTKSQFREVGDRYKYPYQGRENSPGRRNAQAQIRESLYHRGQRTTEGSLDDYGEMKPLIKKVQTQNTSTLGAQARAIQYSGSNPNLSPLARNKGNTLALPLNPRLYTKDKNIDVNLKIELAKVGSDPDGLENYKESAHVLDDIMNAVEQRKDPLSPRGQLQRPLNKVLALKLLQKQNAVNEQQTREQKFLKRQGQVKKQLADFRKDKVAKDAVEKEAKKKERDLSAQRQQKLADQKKKQYDEIKLNYIKNRLPMIEESRRQMEDLDRQQKDDQRRKKKEAEGKINENVKMMGEQFKEFNQKRAEENQVLVVAEQKAMRRETVKREKMASKAKDEADKHRAAKESANERADYKQLLSRSPQPYVSPRNYNQKEKQDVHEKYQQQVGGQNRRATSNQPSVSELQTQSLRSNATGGAAARGNTQKVSANNSLGGKQQSKQGSANLYQLPMD